MKFLKEDGTVEDGTPMSDRQVSLLERFEEYLHDTMCHNSYHGVYGTKYCRGVATAIVPKLDDSACGSLLSAIFEPPLPPESNGETVTPSASKFDKFRELPAEKKDSWKTLSGREASNAARQEKYRDLLAGSRVVEEPEPEKVPDPEPTPTHPVAVSTTNDDISF